MAIRPKPEGIRHVSGRVTHPGPAFGLRSGQAGSDTLYHHLWVSGPLIILLVSPIQGLSINPQRTDWPSQVTENTAGEEDIECFSEYMELWIQKERIDVLKQWLIKALQIPVGLGTQDQLNSFLVDCGYSLTIDQNGNYLFRVQYNGCFMQHEGGYHLLQVIVWKKEAVNGTRHEEYIMKCPMAILVTSKESILCGLEDFQVTRSLPKGSVDGLFSWSLLFRGEWLVTLEDASLIDLHVAINETDITIQGKRKGLLIPREVMGSIVEVLPLWMVSGYYAYSMEASCPPVSVFSEEINIPIIKKRMGLVNRRIYNKDKLTLKSIAVKQMDTYTVMENRDFVMVSIPKVVMQEVQACQESIAAMDLQPFMKINVKLIFEEMVNEVHWNLDNYFDCKSSSVMPATILFSTERSKANGALYSESELKINGKPTPISLHTLTQHLPAAISERSKSTTAEFSETEATHQPLATASVSNFFTPASTLHPKSETTVVQYTSEEEWNLNTLVVSSTEATINHTDRLTPETRSTLMPFGSLASLASKSASKLQLPHVLSKMSASVMSAKLNEADISIAAATYHKNSELEEKMFSTNLSKLDSAVITMPSDNISSPGTEAQTSVTESKPWQFTGSVSTEDKLVEQVSVTSVGTNAPTPILLSQKLIPLATKPSHLALLLTPQISSKGLNKTAIVNKTANSWEMSSHQTNSELFNGSSSLVPKMLSTPLHEYSTINEVRNTMASVTESGPNLSVANAD
ncbi:uncharacterized protein C1orf127 homolog isoform X3 [Heterodontus francisci]|uniref:uncharacterized protein C1orf127 homolog isoform X3 n=1 Tax=Heterodontus francisci TaxID=7792 RepID=UPI00355B789A